MLRSFFRSFEKAPKEYYQYLRGEISRDQLYENFPEQFLKAKREAQCIELGSNEFPHEHVTKTIRSQIGPDNLDNELVIIGGPPCQAYSLVGRSKMSKKNGFNNDPRHTLYLEYLKIIAEFEPIVFVMENVKGMLSSKLDGKPIFDKIIGDLENPAAALGLAQALKSKYKIYSLVENKKANTNRKSRFIIRSENYGIPQARHRVILFAVRNDCNIEPRTLSVKSQIPTVSDAISDLPKLRSGLSKAEDSLTAWKHTIRSEFKDAVLGKDYSRGGEFIKSNVNPQVLNSWYSDPNIGGVINHKTRSHMASDLHRYYFMSKSAAESGKSLKLEDLPTYLLPNHKNVDTAISGKSLFNDRFRVQCANKPSTTITSHISKDGHYFIHYDPAQCRSLTVREAARLQTFPDNYKFEGPRTSQYHQVGNAVPPYLAYQIARITHQLVSSHVASVRSKKLINSRIKNANVKNSEMAL